MNFGPFFSFFFSPIRSEHVQNQKAFLGLKSYWHNTRFFSVFGFTCCYLLFVSSLELVILKVQKRQDKVFSLFFSSFCLFVRLCDGFIVIFLLKKTDFCQLFKKPVSIFLCVRPSGSFLSLDFCPFPTSKRNCFLCFNRYFFPLFFWLYGFFIHISRVLLLSLFFLFSSPSRFLI